MLNELGYAGTQWVVRNGRLNRSAGYHEPGQVIQVAGECERCGHHWRLRRVLQITDCVTELNPETFEPVE